jgi:hypothetical protein
MVIHSVPLQDFWVFIKHTMISLQSLVVYEATPSLESNISIVVIVGDGGRPLFVRNDAVTVSSLVPDASGSGNHSYRPKVKRLGKNLTPAQRKKKQIERDHNRNRDFMMRPPRHLRVRLRVNFC